MSTEAAAGVVPRRAGSRLWTRDLRSTRVLRFAFGVTLSAGIAFGFAWPLFFLTPVLTTFFLSLPLPGPTARQALRFVGYVLGSTALGLAFTLFLLPFPLVYVPVLGLVLFEIYYVHNRGGSVFLAVISLLAVLILPMMSVQHDLLALGFALSFAGSATLALILYLVAHAFFPDPLTDHARAPARKFRSGYSATAALDAMKSTAAILPIAALFIMLKLNSEILVMIYAAMFSMAPDVAKGKASGMKSLKSTLIGGAVAIAFYWLLVAVPGYGFFIALMLLSALMFGRGVFSDHPLSPYMASAMIALLILVGGSLGEGKDFSEKLALRVLLITTATVYVTAALALIQKLQRVNGDP
jgi:hypothetical protein